MILQTVLLHFTLIIKVAIRSGRSLRNHQTLIDTEDQLQILDFGEQNLATIEEDLLDYHLEIHQERHLDHLQDHVIIQQEDLTNFLTLNHNQKIRSMKDLKHLKKEM